MKKIFFMGLWLLAVWDVCAQKFVKKEQWNIPAGFTASSVDWVDIDKDSLLDLVITATSAGQGVLLISKNNFPATFAFQTPLHTGMTQLSVYPADINSDNNTDLIVYGLKSGQPAIGFSFSQGAFVFAAPVFPPDLQDIDVALLRMSDLNRDGSPDLALCGTKGSGDYLWLYENRGNAWVARDSILVTAAGLAIADVDGDTNNDILLSGHNPDSVFTAFVHHAQDFKFLRNTVAIGLEGKISVGDFNSDGNVDAVVAGKKAGVNAAIMLGFNNGTFTENGVLPAVNNPSVFTADMDADGLTDILLSGALPSGDTVNLIRRSSSNFDTLNHTAVAAQRFGDVDRDGDLDVVQLITSGGQQQLVWYANQTETNKAPGAPATGVAITLYNHFFAYWTEAGDDHTLPAAITFDVNLESASGNIMAGDFNMTSDWKRRLVTNGNMGARNFILLNDMPDGNFFFTIQSIDNAFHTGPSVCEGSSSACIQVAVEEVLTCGKEELAFTSPSPNTLWFSFAKGLVGTGTEYSAKLSESDTLFSFVPGQGSACSGIKVYGVKVQQTLTKKERTTRYVCEGSTLAFSAESGWDNIVWSSDAKGFISNNTSISYQVLGADSVRLLLSNATGCNIERITGLVISKPVITASPDQQIVKGQSVPLSVTGGENITWTPPAGLSDAHSSNPIVSPLVTTEYTVTVIDSVGCTASEKVLVVVQETAFIPNLFTPNADTKNDELRIYGLTGVKDFTFSIFNREGNLVYQTSDVSEATTRGWDGTRNGKEQAGGVYYWKVKGEFNGGRGILLNGKKTGSIVLVR